MGLLYMTGAAAAAAVVRGWVRGARTFSGVA